MPRENSSTSSTSCCLGRLCVKCNALNLHRTRIFEWLYQMTILHNLTESQVLRPDLVPVTITYEEAQLTARKSL